MDADLLPKVHLYARYDGPTSYSFPDMNSEKDFTKSLKHEIKVSVTYFWLDADLLPKVHL